MEAHCQCGGISFTTPLPKPLALYVCHCVTCQRQTASAFGASAIFPRFKLPESDLLRCYTYASETSPVMPLTDNFKGARRPTG